MLCNLGSASMHISDIVKALLFSAHLPTSYIQLCFFAQVSNGCYQMTMCPALCPGVGVLIQQTNFTQVLSFQQCPWEEAILKQLKGEAGNHLEIK